MDTLQQIIKFKELTINISDTDTLDDIKEMESYDFEIVTLIYEYCVSKNYTIDGFLERYSGLIENDDEDFYDFLSFKVMSYFGLKNALQHEEIFLFFKTFYFYPDLSECSDEDCKDYIVLAIKILEGEGVSLVFNREDYF